MAKKKTGKHKSPKERRGNPRIVQTDVGVEIHCPFCHPSHVMRVDHASPCGTILELKAIQTLYQDVECALCGKGQGTLLKVGERYQHAHECSPGKRLYTTPPETSRLAKLFWRAPNAFHRFLLRRFGRSIIELSNEGKVTGYAWRPRPKIPQRYR